MTSPGTVARIGTRQVNVTKEIAIGMILGLAGGAIWRGWHLSYKAKVDDYYTKLNAKTESK